MNKEKFDKLIFLVEDSKQIASNNVKLRYSINTKAYKDLFLQFDILKRSNDKYEKEDFLGLSSPLFV